ncbi:hypothetical protein [Pseudomonas viridiflava]|uniref:hypothetical protein n=1 Tax=Pseudomonas viridiflava TaxID=33069 RepID=UPI0013CE7A8D|nr:hypothetical protein [Pseudomonas viridiflava]
MDFEGTQLPAQADLEQKAFFSPAYEHGAHQILMKSPTDYSQSFLFNTLSVNKKPDLFGLHEISP